MQKICRLRDLSLIRGVFQCGAEVYPSVDGNSKNLPRESPLIIFVLHSRRPSVFGYTIPPYRIPTPASQGSAVCNRYILVISDNLSVYKQALLVYYLSAKHKSRQA